MVTYLLVLTPNLDPRLVIGGIMLTNHLHMVADITTVDLESEV
jgi:hypothetical protein